MENSELQKKKKTVKDVFDQLTKENELMLDRLAYKHQDRNCPNCSAPVRGPICEYCGTIHDPTEVDRLEQLMREKRKLLALSMMEADRIKLWASFMLPKYNNLWECQRS